MSDPPKFDLKSSSIFVPTEGRRVRRPLDTPDSDLDDHWPQLVSNASSAWLTVSAEVPGLPRFGASGARDFECDDGKTYVAKPLNRANIAEHVVARIAEVIGAPVPKVALIMVPQALIDEEPSVANFHALVTHGSEWIPGLRDSRVVEYATEQENRIRFARLAVLDALTYADDRQFLYSYSKPHLVYSVDHGYYFPQNRHWNHSALARCSAPCIDEGMRLNASLTEDLISDAANNLLLLSDQEIVNITSSVPNFWGTDDNEKLHLAKWIAKRRDVLVNKYIKK